MDGSYKKGIMTKEDSMLMDGEYKKSPYMLYKYRALGDLLSNWRVMKIIKTCKLYFSCYEDFNDPFDCRINPHKISEDWVKTVIIEPRYPQCSDEEIDDKVKTVNLVEEAKRTTTKFMRGEGLCCFTRTPNNILMWSHYANSHKGICLGFNVREDMGFFYYPVEVQYTDKYPELPDSFTRKYLEILIGTKYAGWSYEQEVRVWKSPVGEYEFNPEALKEIIFGCLISEAIKRIIIREVRRNPALNHVQFFQADTSATDYKLDIKPLVC